MTERKSPTKSATLYKVGTKKTGNDGNKWVVVQNKNKVKKWELYRKDSKKDNNNKIFEYMNTYKDLFNSIVDLSLNYSIDFSQIINSSDIQIYNHYTNQNEMGKFYLIGYLDGTEFTWYEPYRMAVKPRSSEELHKIFYTFYESKNNDKCADKFKFLFDSRIVKLEKNNAEIIPMFISLFMGGGEVIRVQPDRYVDKYAYFWANIPSFVLPNMYYEKRNRILYKFEDVKC
jgi:hypothetical protein